MRLARVVSHDADLLLPDHIAAEVLVEVDRLLVHHAEVARLVVGAEELLAIVNVVDVAPSAAVDRLQKSVFADVGKHRVPVERIFEVAHGAFGCAFGKLLVRQDYCGRDGHAESWRASE